MTGPSPTLASLVALGFERRTDSYGQETVCYRFHHLDLTASAGINRYSRQSVHLGGVLSTGRTVTCVESEIPPNLDDSTAAAACVSYALRSLRRDLEPLPGWIVEGERNWDLIPAVRKQREYKARPRCQVDRDYARSFRRKLKAAMSALLGQTDMRVSFDGRTLSVELDGQEYAIVAEGDAWPCSCMVTVGPETKLPSRFASECVEVSYFDGEFRFDRYCFPAEAVAQ